MAVRYLFPVLESIRNAYSKRSLLRSRLTHVDWVARGWLVFFRGLGR